MFHGQMQLTSELSPLLCLSLINTFYFAYLTFCFKTVPFTGCQLIQINWGLQTQYIPELTKRYTSSLDGILPSCFACNVGLKLDSIFKCKDKTWKASCDQIFTQQETLWVKGGKTLRVTAEASIRGKLRSSQETANGN